MINMNREQVKTLILTILVIMSIIFTQKIWFHSPIRILQSQASYLERETAKIVETRNQLMMPEKATLSLGGNYYTMLSADTENVWKESKKVLEEYFIKEPEIRHISQERYREVRRLKSVELEFGRNIPSILISSIFDTLDNKIITDIKTINKILIPAFNRGSIYIWEEEDIFYEVRLGEHNDSSVLLDFIDDFSTRSHEKYYPLFGDVNNDVVMPLRFTTPIPQVFVESQINANSDSDIINHAKGFFNENLDFVKTIKETSGATMFMYGYGEKGVRINNRGRLEYNEEIGSIASTNVVASLDTAIDFMMEKQQELPESAYLKEIQNINNKGYYFGFGYRIGGFPVAFNMNNMVHPIEVEVYGDKVRSYRSFIREDMNFSEVSGSDLMLLPQKIIEDHIQLLKEDYIADISEEEIPDEQEIIRRIEENISSVEIVYYDTLEENSRQLLTPSWRIVIGNKEYYFDSYEGKLLHSNPLK